MASLPDPRTRIWLDDRLVAREDALVSALDHGVVVGDGAFEALKAVDGEPFAVGLHLARLDRSADALGLPHADHERVREAIAATLAGQDWPLARIRITWTAGPGPLGSGEPTGPGRLVVAAEPVDAAPATTAVVTAPWVRNERGALAGVKSTSYAENVRALAWAHASGASEAIFANTRGELCEGTGTNVFCVIDGELVTPPLTSGALAGITRALVVRWCEAVERELTLKEAQAADEVFLTSSLRDVQAVECWGDRSWPAPGPVTARVREVFADRSGIEPDPR